MRRGGATAVLGAAALSAAMLLAACASDGDGRSAAAGPAEATTTGVATSEVATTAPSADHHGGTDGGPTDPDRPTIVDFGGDERADLAAQLVTAREVALRLPTVADAEAAGYELTTPYAPGTGAHYGKDADTQAPGQPLDLQRPQSYLYDGTDPTSRVVGLMYVQLGGDTAPDGFVGPLDTWEPFRGQCLEQDTTDPVFPTKDSVTEAECDAAGGRYLDVTAWIQHVWVVPGWEAPGGVFAHANADLVCADGTTNSDDVEGCPAPTHP